MSRIVAILTIIGFAFGAYFYIDANYAKCEEVRKIERRLDYKIKNDQFISNRDRLWTMQDRYGADHDKVADPIVKQRMKELQSDMEVQQNQLHNLERQ